jgi:dihydrofolate reductase
MIVAMDENRAIGKDNDLLCHRQRADMKRFKDLTTGGLVVMGRKTWDSLPEMFKPLPKRLNIVLTSNPESFDGIDNVKAFSTPESVLDECKARNRTVWIMGGAQIYKKFAPLCDNIYLTKIHHKFEGADTHVAEFPDMFEQTHCVSFQADDNNEYPYSFITLKNTVESLDD